MNINSVAHARSVSASAPTTSSTTSRETQQSPPKVAESGADTSDSTIVSYYPQDPATLGLSTTRISTDGSGRLATRRIVVDEPDLIVPDKDGNWIAAPDTRAVGQTTSFVAATRTLGMFEHTLGHEIPWSFEGPLAIHAHAGEGINAHYTRNGRALEF
jgi:hypothetical protein